MADQMAYTGSGQEHAPTVDDVKALQASIGKPDYHIVWLGMYLPAWDKFAKLPVPEAT